MCGTDDGDRSKLNSMQLSQGRCQSVYYYSSVSDVLTLITVVRFLSHLILLHAVIINTTFGHHRCLKTVMLQRNSYVDFVKLTTVDLCGLISVERM